MSYSRTDLIDGEPDGERDPGSLLFSVDAPEIPKLLRNGAEHMRLSTRALAAAYFKLPEGRNFAGFMADWLGEQVASSFMKEWQRLREEMAKTVIE